MATDEVPLTLDNEKKVLEALRRTVYYSKVLEHAYENKKKWVLQSSEPSHKSKVFAKMYNNRDLADITIKVLDKDYYLHRAYVGEWSPVLKKQFESQDKTPHQILEVPASGQSSSRIYDYLFQFMYFDQIAIPTRDYLNVLAIACKYQVAPLITELSNIAPDLIDVKQAIKLIEQAWQIESPELKGLIDKCNEMISGNFESIISSGEIVHFGIRVLKGLLMRDDIAVEETDILKAVRLWTAHSTDRVKHLDELLELVRFPVMDSVAISLLDEDELYTQTPKLKQYMLEALKYIANPDIFSAEERATKRFEGRYIAKVDETFNYDSASEVIKEYVIPGNGYYQFIARGAKGGDGTSKKGGKGAIITATFYLTRGDKLEILTGGPGALRSQDTGGGGGTFVAINGRKNPLIVAGGGGGTRGSASDEDGADASITTAGNPGKGRYHSEGGKDGQGAKGCTSSYGGGGGGYFSDGIPDGSGTTPGICFMNGGAKVECGGFGGGGNCGNSGGGGGGGYSGGGAGQGGGGGGSYVRKDGLGVSKEVGHDGPGSLQIKTVRKPKPGT